MPYNGKDRTAAFPSPGGAGRRRHRQKGLGPLKEAMTAAAMHKQYSDGVTTFRQHIANPAMRQMFNAGRTSSSASAPWGCGRPTGAA